MIIGCASTDANNAHELLEQTNLAMGDINSMSLAFSSETTAPILGLDADMLIESETAGTIEVMNNSSDSFEAKAEIMQEMTGVELEYTAYFRDNQMYVDLTDLMDMGLKEGREISNPFGMININLDFSESDIIQQSVEHMDEGIQLTFSLGDEALLETINAQLHMIDLEIDQLTETDYDLVILIDDNYIIQWIELKINLAFESEAGEGEKTMFAHVDVTLEEVTFDFPEIIDEFMEFVASIPAF